ncbi:MAG: hypothetical protein K6T86_08890 [Pirellulales bacterium]|nr:hypothetical protein [Pirellulales bacterium]
MKSSNSFLRKLRQLMKGKGARVARFPKKTSFASVTGPAIKRKFTLAIKRAARPKIP